MFKYDARPRRRRAVGHPRPNTNNLIFPPPMLRSIHTQHPLAVSTISPTSKLAGTFKATYLVMRDVNAFRTNSDRGVADNDSLSREVVRYT